jgi:hypothetical protein
LVPLLTILIPTTPTLRFTAFTLIELCPCHRQVLLGLFASLATILGTLLLRFFVITPACHIVDRRTPSITASIPCQVHTLFAAFGVDEQ